MKIKIKTTITREVTLTKSKVFPACWEYKLDGKTYTVTPYALRNDCEPFDMTEAERIEYYNILSDPKYSLMYGKEPPKGKDKYEILISVNNGYPDIDISGNTPFVLADTIKKVVREFYHLSNKTNESK